MALTGEGVGLQGERGTDTELHIQLDDLVKVLKVDKRLSGGKGSLRKISHSLRPRYFK